GLPPVPVAVDQEGGSVIRIGYRATFPSAMAIGATGDPAYAERAARAVGEGLRADGIAVNHAPVCDVNSDPRNPVIGTRAFGDDATSVAAFAAAWVRGSEGDVRRRCHERRGVRGGMGPRERRRRRRDDA